jgi:transcriptional regulator with XRE-family HTH domain
MAEDSANNENAIAWDTLLEATVESADAVLAKNLLVARVVVGITQHRLAQASGVSRATIAQLETGRSDPRLSTIVLLARALGIPAIALLMGKPETLALTTFLENPSTPISLGDGDVARMQGLLKTGMLKDRLRAALVGAGLARGIEDSAITSQIMAAIFSAIHPGPGTIAGTALGNRLTENANPQHEQRRKTEKGENQCR